MTTTVTCTIPANYQSNPLIVAKQEDGSIKCTYFPSSQPFLCPQITAPEPGYIAISRQDYKELLDRIDLHKKNEDAYRNNAERWKKNAKDTNERNLQLEKENLLLEKINIELEKKVKYAQIIENQREETTRYMAKSLRAMTKEERNIMGLGRKIHREGYDENGIRIHTKFDDNEKTLKSYCDLAQETIKVYAQWTPLGLYSNKQLKDKVVGEVNLYRCDDSHTCYDNVMKNMTRKEYEDMINWFNTPEKPSDYKKIRPPSKEEYKAMKKLEEMCELNDEEYTPSEDTSMDEVNE